MAQIFIAHSSKDKLLIDWIAGTLRNLGVIPYIAEYDNPFPDSLQEKLGKAISQSQTVFLILTRNVSRSKHTSLAVQWEIAIAQAKKIPVYVFKEKGVSVPLMIKLTEVYGTFDPVSRDSLVEAMRKMASIGKRLKTQEEQNRAMLVEVFGNLAKTIFSLLQP